MTIEAPTTTELPGGGTPVADPTAATPAEQPQQKVDLSFAEEDANLAELQRQVAEEAAAKAAAATTTPAAAPAAAAATPAAAPAAAATPAAVATPDTSQNNATSAIIALRKQVQQLRDAFHVEKGKNEALTALQAQQPAQGELQQAQPTVDELLEAIEAQYGEIATKIDAGDLTAAEAELQRRALRKQERELLVIQTREETLAAVSQSAQPANDLGLEEHMTQLVADYPLITRITAAQLKPFEELAYEQAKAQGKPIQPGPTGTRDLRTRMLSLAEQFYDPPAHAARLAATAAANGNGQGQGQGGQQPQGGTQGKPAAAAQPTAAQREAKLVLASAHPPDLQTIGAGAQAGELTLEQGEAIANSLKGDDLQKWMAANPGFVRKVMGNSVRL